MCVRSPNEDYLATQQLRLQLLESLDFKKKLNQKDNQKTHARKQTLNVHFQKPVQLALLDHSISINTGNLELRGLYEALGWGWGSRIRKWQHRMHVDGTVFLPGKILS